MIEGNFYGIKMNSAVRGRAKLITNALWNSLDRAVDSFFSKREELGFVMIERSDHVEIAITREDKSLVKCRFVPCEKGAVVTEEILEKLLLPLL